MPATVLEREKYRRTSGRTAERQYIIKNLAGGLDQVTARTAMLAAAPTAISTLARLDIECDVDEVVADKAFTGKCVYGIPQYDAPPINTFNISFDLAGLPTRVTQSYETLQKIARTGKTAKDFKGAINVTDGGVEGVDVLIPYLNYTVNYTFAPTDIDAAYLQILRATVGKQNNGIFHGFAAGELLLTRVSGSTRPNPADPSTDAWDVSFGFSVSENATEIDLGSGIVIPTKNGWDYLWVYYEKDIDTTNNFVNPVPVSAYVERVYKQATFGLLGI
jgi:hypothetical protein